ncbi:MAG: class I SAM-dependent methyltransferase [Gemmatimonadaceae bacterium]
MKTGAGRDKWSERYREASSQVRAPSDWVLQAARQIPAGATIVDLAGGLGRHACPLATSGRSVVLIDFIPEALLLARRTTPSLNTVAADLWALPLANETVDALIVVNFLERELFPMLQRVLRPGGFMVYETFTLDHPVLFGGGDTRGPRSPDHLLAPGELRTLVRPMEILQYREGIVDDAAGKRACASVLARKS